MDPSSFQDIERQGNKLRKITMILTGFY